MYKEQYPLKKQIIPVPTWIDNYVQQ